MYVKFEQRIYGARDPQTAADAFIQRFHRYILLPYLIGINLAAYLAMGIDKRKAKGHCGRIPQIGTSALDFR